MIVLFPFEKKFYANHDIHAEYVGHPLVDKHSAYLPAELKKIDPGNITIGLLPGSRKQEVVTLLPKMLETVRSLWQEGSIHKVEIVKVPNLPQEYFNDLIKDTDSFISIVEKPLKDSLPAYDAVIGTARQ